MNLDGLISSLAAGNARVFDEIYQKTVKTVYYIALSVVKERSAAEDVVQTTYLNVLRAAKQYQKGTNALAWIARIARNEAVNLYKKRKREEGVDVSDPAILPSFGTTETDDYGLLVDFARRNLPEDEFSVLMLAAAEGYKRREIAEILGLPVSTVTWKYNQAMQKMRAYLKEDNQKTGKGGRK